MSRKFNVMLGLGALAAFGFASSAFAQCPTDPVPPWSSAPALQGSLSIQAGGLGGTSCHLDSTINSGASGAAFAFVQDDTPTAEPRYRAQFLMNADGVASQQLLEVVRVFAVGSTAHLGRNQPIQAYIYGLGGTRFLNVIVANEGVPGNTTSAAFALAAGENRIEFDWDVTGTVTVWVNNTNEAVPTHTFNVNNAGWVGIDTAYLGLATPSTQFVANHAGVAIQFDEFDSRRQTFIGN